MSARRKVVAIIDDNLRLLGAMSRLLAGLGYHTELYASAKEFLEVAMTSEALCLIVDIQLADSCGLKLARHLAKTGFTVPIIFMTANGDEALRKQATEIGCVGFLLKPFSAEVLMELLTTVSRHSSRTSNKHH
jgi:FixJ family two-component response regulator